MFKQQKLKIILIVSVLALAISTTLLLDRHRGIPEAAPPAEVATEMPSSMQGAAEITTRRDRGQSKPAEAPEETKRESREATLDIEGRTYRNEIPETTSVYDFMDTLRESGKINFKDRTYIGLGKFIEEINGIRGNNDKFWIYYVNGKKASVGVSNYKIHPGDVVSWKFEKEL